MDPGSMSQDDLNRFNAHTQAAQEKIAKEMLKVARQQSRFNRLIAFTSCILAVPVVLKILKDLGWETTLPTWISFALGILAILVLSVLLGVIFKETLHNQ